MIFNVTGGGGGTGGALTVTAPANVTVTVSKDSKTKTKTVDSSGVAVFKGLSSGVWTVTIAGDGKTAQKIVTITTDYSTAISFNAIPEFTYTGDFEIVSDDDQPITVSQDNWKIRFLTSGTLIFTSLNGAENGIDVFLVGGGGNGSTYNGKDSGAGGGGGYTDTIKGMSLIVGSPYDIVIGAAAGDTQAFTYTAGKGGNASNRIGGNGGSGGGAAVTGSLNGSSGGSDGSDGGKNGTYTPGTGQGTTTREFGEPDGKLYAGGGGAGGGGNTGYKGGAGGSGGGGAGGDAAKPGNDGTANTGGGGGGAGGSGGSPGVGGSGIVIIRDAREVV